MPAVAISEDAPAPAAIDIAVESLASGLDAAFLEAGNTLSDAYRLVEELIANLADLAGALDRDAASRAVANMQEMAERIEALPERISARAQALAAIGAASRSVHQQLFGVGRTIEFLRICGLNIKVASGGLHGFSEFADQMLAKLDQSEDEIREVRSEVRELSAMVPRVLASDAELAGECAAVVGDVPRRLTQNALALRDYLEGAEAQSEGVAEVACRLRSQLAEALGAMQIGDITRQRLEHVATGFRMVEAELAAGAQGDDEAAAARHVLALLEAQCREAVADFQRESGRLYESQQQIGAEVEAMLALQRHGDDDGPSGDLLAALEQGVAGAGALTGRLREADGHSQALGTETGSTVARVGQRLALIHRITAEVGNMAWNTDLRCYRLGQQGVGIARIAVEIRALVSTLEAICIDVDAAVARLNDAAGQLAQGSAAEEGSGGQTLEQSLEVIREGARRTGESAMRLDQQASSAAAVLGTAAEAVAAIDTFSAPLDRIAEDLRDAAGTYPEVAGENNAQAQALLEQIARLYTMASERQLHRLFAPDEAGSAEGAACPEVATEDDDDGLF
ncbi:chemotaxis protein [Sphingomonas swuensis]|uniref:Chemotaxis protein n=1 Tax=Sphingomonas swuensis TaxID=977800 RepID=A0ABP7SI76_9SPHN